jgi:hypothetical protein
VIHVDFTINHGDPYATSRQTGGAWPRNSYGRSGNVHLAAEATWDIETPKVRMLRDRGYGGELARDAHSRVQPAQLNAREARVALDLAAQGVNKVVESVTQRRES